MEGFFFYFAPFLVSSSHEALVEENRAVFFWGGLSYNQLRHVLRRVLQ